MLILWAAAIILAILLGLVIYARWNYGTLERMGVPLVEKPHFIFGNALSTFDKGAGLIDVDRMKKFGPVYGVYEGRQPQLHVCDAELIRLITTKDAEYFNAKRMLVDAPIFREFVDMLTPYDKWKTVRSFLTPSFSSARIKAMNDSMNESLTDFCSQLKEQVESSPGKNAVNYDLSSGYFTMITDLIGRSWFNVKVDNPNDPNNALVSIIRDLLQSPANAAGPSMAGDVMAILMMSFPFLGKLVPASALVNMEKFNTLRQILKGMIEARRQSGIKMKDTVDLAIEQMDKLETVKYKQLGITDETILAQVFLFFAGGSDQFSHVCGVLVYYMLKNPEIERRLYEEVDDFLERHNGKIDVANVGELHYVKACINETLRLSPLFGRTERVCTKDWENEEFGLKIKKGTVIMIPIWAANKNPKYFEDPDTFYPDRFLPANKDKLHPCGLTSFGFGPRNCIVMWFSMDAMILLNAHVLKTFKFHLRPESKLEYLPGGGLFAPILPIHFDVSLRN